MRGRKGCTTGTSTANDTLTPSEVSLVVLGHRHPRVMEAMRCQMDMITLAPPLIADKGDIDDTIRFLDQLLMEDWHDCCNCTCADI